MQTLFSDILARVLALSDAPAVVATLGLALVTSLYLVLDLSTILLPRRQRAAALLTPAKLTDIFRHRYANILDTPEEAATEAVEVLTVSSGGDGKSQITDRIQMKVRWQSGEAQASSASLGVLASSVLATRCAL